MITLLSAFFIGIATYIFIGGIPTIKIAKEIRLPKFSTSNKRKSINSDQNFLEFLWNLKTELSTGSTTHLMDLNLPIHKHGPQLQLILESCFETGAALTPTLNRLIKKIKFDIELSQEIVAELASTKATVSILAGLPFFGLLLSSLLSGNSIQWLIGTSAGRLCLGLGLLLNGLGVLWLKKIVSSSLAK